MVERTQFLKEIPCWLNYQLTDKLIEYMGLYWYSETDFIFFNIHDSLHHSWQSSLVLTVCKYMSRPWFLPYQPLLQGEGGVKKWGGGKRSHTKSDFYMIRVGLEGSTYMHLLSYQLTWRCNAMAQKVLDGLYIHIGVAFFGLLKPVCADYFNLYLEILV